MKSLSSLIDFNSFVNDFPIFEVFITNVIFVILSFTMFRLFYLDHWEQSHDDGALSIVSFPLDHWCSCRYLIVILYRLPWPFSLLCLVSLVVQFLRMVKLQNLRCLLYATQTGGWELYVCQKFSFSLKFCYRKWKFLVSVPGISVTYLFIYCFVYRK